MNGAFVPFLMVHEFYLSEGSCNKINYLLKYVSLHPRHCNPIITSKIHESNLKRKKKHSHKHYLHYNFLISFHSISNNPIITDNSGRDLKCCYGLGHSSSRCSIISCMESFLLPSYSDKLSKLTVLFGSGPQR